MNLLGMESVDHLPSNLTHDPRVYSRLLTEEDLRKERENKDDKKMEYHNELKQEREDKEHKEPEERERRSPNRSKPDPQLMLQALTPRDVRILVQAEEELSQTKVKLFFSSIRFS